MLSWNAAGWLSNGLEFGFLVSNMENPPAVMCIQESKLKGGVSCKIKGYVCYRKDKVDSLHACAGVLIFVSEDVSSYEVECEEAEMLKVNVNYEEKNYTVVNVYVRHAKEIDGLTECSGKERCIVCGDFNTHHGMLGSDRVNRNGYSLEKVLEETELSVVNDATPTRFSVTGKGSVLDLFLVSSDMVHKCEMKVEETSCGSDHRVVKLILRVKGNRLGQESRKRVMDWQKYGRKSGRIKCEKVGNAEDVAEQYVNKINEVRKDCMLEGPKRKRWRYEWWNNDCDRVVEETKEMEKMVKEECCIENIIRYKRKRSEVRRVLKARKRGFWYENICRLSRAKNLKGMLKLVKNFKGDVKAKRSILQLEIKGRITGDKMELVEGLKGAMFNKIMLCAALHAEKKDDTISVGGSRRVWSGMKEMNDRITLKEVKDALKEARESAPGRDGVEYNALKSLQNINGLLDFYNALWERGEMPRQFKEAVIVLMLKPMKDAIKSDSYRPISLLSCVGKVYEKIVYKRLRYYVEQNKVLPDVQNGFRPNRSTSDNIAILSGSLYEAINTGGGERNCCLLGC